ncbi:MAG: hypothetical protein ACLGG8_07810 [Gammaproteobacteria bacterium]
MAGIGWIPGQGRQRDGDMKRSDVSVNPVIRTLKGAEANHCNALHHKTGPDSKFR